MKHAQKYSVLRGLCRGGRQWGFTLCLALASGVVCAADVSGAIQGAAKKVSPNSLEQNPSTDSASVAIEQPLLPKGNNSEIGETTGINPLAYARETMGNLEKGVEFKYDAKGKPDPMLVPWSRLKIMLDEYLAIAEESVKSGDTERAKKAYIMAYRLLNTTVDPWVSSIKGLDPLREKVMAGLRSLRVDVTKIGFGAGVVPASVELPQWVRDNVSGVVYSANDPVCLIGSFTLHQGQLVPNQPVDVTVKKIEEDKVYFQILEQTYVVNLRKGE